MEGSPEKLANFIFSEEPKESNSCDLQVDESDGEYLFEILINVFIKGLQIKNYIDYKNDKMIRMGEKELLKMKKYMRSISFDLHVDIKEFDEYVGLTDSDYLQRYCSVVFYDSSIHFVRSRNFSGECLPSYKATFIDENRTRMYVISFSYFIDTSSCKS